MGQKAQQAGVSERKRLVGCRTRHLSAVKPQGKESCWMGEDAKKEGCLEGFSKHFGIKEEQLEDRR